MAEEDPSSFPEIVRRALESRVNDIHISIPGQVQAYDSSTQTVDVLPMVKRPLPTLAGDTVFEELPVLPGIRVSFQRSGPFSITFPIAPGDEGMIMVSAWDFSTWMASGVVSEPADLRLHHPNHAWFLPGICSDGNVISPDPGTDALVIAGSDLRLGAVDASDAVTLAGALYDWLKAEFVDGWTPVPNDGGAALHTLLSTWFSTHPRPGPFAATKVKAK